MCSRCGRGRARRAARSHRGPTPVGLRRDEGGHARGLAAIALPRRKKNLSIPQLGDSIGVLAQVVALKQSPHLVVDRRRVIRVIVVHI